MIYTLLYIVTLLTIFFASVGANAQVPLLIKEIKPGLGGSQISKLFSSGTKVYFSANDSIHGAEPWVSDGTSIGTLMMRDIAEGTASSNPSDFYYGEDNLHFTAYNSSTGRELYRGLSNTGAMLLKDINLNGNANPKPLLWYNGKLMFTATDGTSGTELWSTNNLASATNMLFDLNPRGDGAFGEAYIYKGKLYYIASDGINSNEIWVSDGTANSPEMLKNIAYVGSSGAKNFHEFNGLLYFSATDGNNGNELWVTDGTSSNTRMVADITAGPASSKINNLTTYKEYLYFEVGEGIQTSIWRTDGTEQGTSRFLANAFSLCLYNNQLIVNRFDYLTEDFSLWITNEDTSLAYEFAILRAYGSNSEPVVQYAQAGGLLYIMSNYNLGTGNIWATNGTASGTILLTPHNTAHLQNSTGPVDIAPGMVIAGNSLFFVGSMDTIGNNELYTIAIPTTINEVVRVPQITVSPNPLSDAAHISFEASLEVEVLRLYDLQGKEIWAQEVAENTTSVIFYTTLLSTGIYVLRAQGKNGSFSATRLVK